MPPRLILLTLGGLGLEGQELQPNSAGMQRSRLALLAAVAASGDGGMSRDQLLALFWPDSDTERARGSLKQAIYVLRRDLGPDLFLDTDDLRLNPARITADVSEFDAAFRRGDWEEVVTRYQGPFLHGVHIGNGEFSHWRDGEERRLAGRYRRALERLARDADDAGDLFKARDWWQALAAADPLSASAAVGLMRALVRTGDRSAALRHAAIHAQLVRSDLDAEPDPAVTRLAEEIRTEASAVAAAIEAVIQPEPAAAVDVGESAAPPMSPSRPGRPVARWVAGTAAALTVGLLLAPLRPDPDLIRIDVRTIGSTPAEADLTQDIARQIQLRAPGLHFGGRWGLAARYRIAAEVRAGADSLYLTARVTDRTGTGLRAIDPVVVPRAATQAGLRHMADMLAIAIAAGRSPVLASWAPTAAIPDTWDGLQALDAALRAWNPPAQPGKLFQAAARLDPTSGTPIVLEALSLSKARLTAASDSLLDQLAASSRRLGPWDRAVIDVARAWNHDDFAAGHAASHRLLELAPRSEWALFTAYAAIHLGRGRETLDLLARIPPDLAWPRRWSDIIRGQALMQVGDYDGALAHAQAGLIRNREDPMWRQTIVKALAAMGRVEEVEAICTRALTESINAVVVGQAVSQLRAYGHQADAARLVARYLAAVRSTGASEAAYNEERALIDYNAGLWDDMDQALRALPAERIDRNLELRSLRVMAAAARGDRIAVRTELARVSENRELVAQVGPAELAGLRAEVAALLGDRDEAVALVAEMLRRGFPRELSFNILAGLDRLKGYAPFDQLVRPVEDPAHLAAYALH